jgi:hypothetical protein
MRPKIDFKNPSYIEIYQYRQSLLLNLKKSPENVKAAKIYYRDNPVDFIEDFMVTYDPRKKIKDIPFMLFPKQKDFIEFVKRKWEEGAPWICEKSRDMGITWLCIAFACWALLFLPGIKCSFGSRKSSLVDEIGNIDSILEKARYILKNVPVELLPDGFNIDKNCGWMKIKNPETGASITGEAGDNIGRGGRASIYFLDEAAFIERPDKVNAALSQNTDCLGKVSTPNGTGNPFYRERHGGKIEVFVFDWRDDPRKDEAWYQKQKDELDAVTVAQEIDRDYAASAHNIVFPAEWVRAAIDFDLEKIGKKFMGFDVADEGKDEKCLLTRVGSVVTDIEQWKEGDAVDASRYAREKYNREKPDYFNYDVIGVGAAVRTSFPKGMKGVNPVSFARAVSPGKWDDDRYCKDVFQNGKAEMYWRVRRRFENTYKHRIKGEHKENHEMISIPNNHLLISELSVIKYELNDNGLYKIQSKKKMKDDGIKSPNIVDSLVYAYDANFKSSKPQRMTIRGI